MPSLPGRLTSITSRSISPVRRSSVRNWPAVPGAALGAVIAIYFGLAALSPVTGPLMGMIGALGACALTFALGRNGTVALVLAGAAVSSLFVHKRLSVSVGHCVAAFARDVLEHPAGAAAPAGVWYPEEACAVADAALLLQRAATGTADFQLNRGAWQLETRSKQLGFGLYLD